MIFDLFAIERIGDSGPSGGVELVEGEERRTC